MIPEDLINLCLVCFLNNAKPVIHLIGTIHLSERNHFQTDNKLITLTRQNSRSTIERVIQFHGHCSERDIERCLALYDVTYDTKKKTYNGPFALKLADVCRRNWCLLFLIPQIYNTPNKIGPPDYPDRSKPLSWLKFCIIAETATRS